MKYNRKNIMNRAWEIKRIHTTREFGVCLYQAWKEAKEEVEEKAEEKTEEAVSAECAMTEEAK